MRFFIVEDDDSDVIVGDVNRGFLSDFSFRGVSFPLLLLLLFSRSSTFCFASNDSLNDTDRTNASEYLDESLYFDGNFLFFFQFLY